MNQSVYCRECGNKLAEMRSTGSWETRRRGRVVIAPSPGFSQITCEECGAVWTPGSTQPGDTAGRLAMPTVRRVA